MIQMTCASGVLVFLVAPTAAHRLPLGTESRPGRGVLFAVVGVGLGGQDDGRGITFLELVGHAKTPQR